MYQALYRKWRPRTFDDVVGQAHVSETLKSQVSCGRLSHAYLFIGTRGTGKTSCAKILAKAVNCLQPQDGNPCNQCASCVGIDSGSILDVLELDAASNNGVDNVRALREEAVFSPVDVKKRVYIIDEVHMLSTAAFNALLKILEEPPEHLIFILATTELHKVPATILSRCQRYMFKRIPAADIAGRLQDVAGREGIGLTADAAGLLARLADGSLRDALSLFDQCAATDTVDADRVISAIGLAGSGEIAALFDAVADGDVPAALGRLDRLYADGKVMSAVLEELLALVRDTLVTALMPEGGSGLLGGGFDADTLAGFAGRIPEDRLLSMLELLRQALGDVSKDAGGKLAAEICLIRLTDVRTQTGTPAVKNTVTRYIDKAREPRRTPVPEAAASAAISPPVEKPEPLRVEPMEASAPDTLPSPADDTPETHRLPDDPAAQDTTQQQPSPDLDELWTAVLGRVQKKLDTPTYSFLSDPLNAADLTGDTLTVKLKNPFIMKAVNVPHVTDALKEAAASLLGRPVAVRIAQDTGGKPETSDKIDELKRYNIIRFE